MNHPCVYEDGLRYVLENGRKKTDRTGTGTISVFGMQMRFPLHKYFPAVTTKKLFWKGITVENCWFLKGDTNIKYLVDRGVHIWDEWADADGNLGPVYGSQWRAWPGELELSGMHWENYGQEFRPVEFTYGTAYVTEGDVRYRKIDQIANVLASLRDNPDSRRHIVSAWNPAQVDNMALPPCHALFQFYVEELTRMERVMWAEANGCDKAALRGLSEEPQHKLLDSMNVPRRRLSCQLYQRSADMFLGVPFNIAGYSLLTHMFAQQLGYAVGDFVWTGGDCHIYTNHLDQVREQLSRETLAPPQLRIRRKPASLFDYEPEDFELVGYEHHPAISAPVAV